MGEYEAILQSAFEMQSIYRLLMILHPPPFPGAGGQRLRPGGGLVGPGRGHVRDDVRSAALLQPGPRAALRAHPHGGDPLPAEPGPRGQGPAGRPAEEGPQAEVRTGAPSADTPRTLTRQPVSSAPRDSMLLYLLDSGAE